MKKRKLYLFILLLLMMFAFVSCSLQNSSIPVQSDTTSQETTTTSLIETSDTSESSSKEDIYMPGTASPDNALGWLAVASEDPVEVVKSAIENEAQKDYTITVEFKSAEVDEDATNHYCESYKGSDLAKSRGWTDEMFDEGHFVVVYAEYYVEYDGTKTPNMSGNWEQNFFLLQDKETLIWSIVDNSWNQYSGDNDVFTETD